MKRKTIILSPKDNVATVLTDLEAGEVVKMEIDMSTLSVTLVDAIPFGHKFSLSHIKSGSPIVKYGEIIGKATTDIQPGQHVHVHNVAGIRGYSDIAVDVKK